MCVCVCVCVRERERESVCAVSVCLCMCLRMCVHTQTAAQFQLLPVHPSPVLKNSIVIKVMNCRLLTPDRVRTLVDLGPETVLKCLLCLLQLLGVPECVQVSQHPHHFGEPVNLQKQGTLTTNKMALSGMWAGGTKGEQGTIIRT
jgi:hypothetical protein